MNLCRCSDGFSEAKNSGSLKLINSVTALQSCDGDNCWYENSYQCAICKSIWIIDSRTENGKEIEEVKEFKISKNNNGSQTIDPDIISCFTGSWTDNNGAVINIYYESGRFKADYLRTVTNHDNSLKDFSRRNLNARLVETTLIIELDTEEFKTTLELSLVKTGDACILAPSLSMGLYDDFSEDLGVPWAQPLKFFEKISG